MNADRLTRRALTVLIIIGWLLLFCAVIHTTASFAPRARQIEMDLADMDEQLDAMWDGLQEVQP